MSEAVRDQNHVASALGVSSSDLTLTLPFLIDPITGRLLTDQASGSGTVTQINTGAGLTGGPITTTGTIALDSKLSPLDTLGTAGQLIRVNAGATALEYFTSSGGVASVTGTTNRIAVNNTDPANPIVDIDSAYVGQTSITTLGAVATGTWNATTVAVNHGGTAKTSVTIAAAASSWAGWDANKNLSANAFIQGFTTTATAAGTTTLTIASTETQVFTGVTTQTVKLPTTSVAAGATYTIINLSSGAVTIQSSGANTVEILAGGSSATFTALIATPTTAGNWTTQYLGIATASGKLLTVSNSLTFSGTDGSSVAFGTGGTVLYSASTIPLTVGTTTIASGTSTRILYDNAGVLGEYTLTGSGTVVVMATSPTLVTPTLGVATATSINKVALTAPATSATLTIADGKTLTVNDTTTIATNSITLAGGEVVTFTASNALTLATTGTTVSTFPAGTHTLGGLDVAQTWTAQNKFNNIIDVNNAVTVTTNAGTVPVTFRLNTFTNSSAATMAITMATASAVDGQMTIVRIYDFSGVAETIGWTNTENSTVSVPTTSNGSTTLPLTVGFMYNGATSKWRCIASA